MSDGQRQAIRPGAQSFGIGALVVTSRSKESLDDVPRTSLSMLRVEGDSLSSFMDAYLVRCGKRQLFKDPEYFDCCSRLSLMVGKRNLTVMIAKMYADQMIAMKGSNVTLPESIPDLMLSYVKEIGGSSRQDRLDDGEVCLAAKVIAWECLRRRYRPMPAKLEDVKRALGKKSDFYIAYLMDRLLLIQKVGASYDQIRFSLDPLGEYLAAIYIAERWSNSEDRWRTFISESALQDGAPESIKGFLNAVLDCCLAKKPEGAIPTFVSNEISRQLGL